MNSANTEQEKLQYLIAALCNQKHKQVYTAVCSKKDYHIEIQPYNLVDLDIKAKLDTVT